MSAAPLALLGAFDVITRGRRDQDGDYDYADDAERVDAWIEPDGRVRCVIDCGDQVRSTRRDSPDSGQWFAARTDAGIRYVSEPVTRGTFRRWCRQAESVADVTARARAEEARYA